MRRGNGEMNGVYCGEEVEEGWRWECSRLVCGLEKMSERGKLIEDERERVGEK